MNFDSPYSDAIQIVYKGFKRVREALEKEGKVLRMTPSEELFAKYYNKGKVLVAAMNDTELREFREELSKVATEAKAQLVAADDAIRERSASKRVKDKEWLVTTDTDLATTDQLNKVVDARKQRMSKMDKLRAQLLAAGIDEDTVKEMVGNLEKKATEKQVKTITFQKPSTETAVLQVPVAKPVDDTPFDMSKLKFGS